MLKEAIWRYGTECGQAVRQGVEGLGLAPTLENYGRVPDLPKYGWEKGLVQDENGVPQPKVTYCPLAAVWLEKGSTELGRLYCFVDQAKYQSYNGSPCRHVRNVLDGDGYCLFKIG